MPPRPRDPHPLARRLACRRRALRQSLAAVAAELSTTERPRTRQVVSAWERGALPRSIELPGIARWLGEPLSLVRSWWRTQRRIARDRRLVGDPRVGPGVYLPARRRLQQQKIPMSHASMSTSRALA